MGFLQAQASEASDIRRNRAESQNPTGVVGESPAKWSQHYSTENGLFSPPNLRSPHVAVAQDDNSRSFSSPRMASHYGQQSHFDTPNSSYNNRLIKKIIELELKNSRLNSALLIKNELEISDEKHRREREISEEKHRRSLIQEALIDPKGSGKIYIPILGNERDGEDV